MCVCVCVCVQMMLLLCCEMFYCLYWSVVDSELSFKMLGVYDSDLLLPVDVM